MSVAAPKMQTETHIYPRPLRPKERDLLEFVLPADRPGYRRYRERIAGMMVLAEGRRGRGNVVLGMPGARADITSPLAAVVAYGVVETTRDTFTITVRECVDDQIDVEIVSSHGESIPDHFEEKRRWTYSSWRPGSPSPATETPVREIPITATLTLAISSRERRIWLFDAATGMNHLIPITNYHNELMRHKGVRDPAVALAANRFFDDLNSYSDADLRAAFIAYNRVRKKVELVPEPETASPRGWRRFLRRIFRI